MSPTSPAAWISAYLIEYDAEMIINFLAGFILKMVCFAFDLQVHGPELEDHCIPVPQPLSSVCGVHVSCNHPGHDLSAMMASALCMICLISCLMIPPALTYG
jgi:hypothetical protein